MSSLENEDHSIKKVKEVKEIFNSDIIIEAINITKDFEIGEFIVRAVDDISLKIKSGEFVVIMGPSGAGKTTLLNLIGGLDTPTKGIIFSFGIKISDMEQDSLTLFRLVNSGFIFQNYNLISTLTAEENIMFPMGLSGVSLKEQRERAIFLLNELGLGDRREHLPFQLSAGEQQRVAIARALANDPPVILADEPTANLDKDTSKFIKDLFLDMKKTEKTVIVATHDDYLIDLADRVIIFQDGIIIEENR
ncbi:MAG: ATP-binding cassette domain-containing protein [Candidatus Lokiarchaeota archaeon]|nr:ATP-binding cassette domain-containing protein [Candidatus Lokiarchaeota archaeon]MBD3200337.1 ATP-binding cassette domain-containing protein [Candidatus Lokiarchaeota archaeon]